MFFQYHVTPKSGESFGCNSFTSRKNNDGVDIVYFGVGGGERILSACEIASISPVAVDASDAPAHTPIQLNEDVSPVALESGTDVTPTDDAGSTDDTADDN